MTGGGRVRHTTCALCGQDIEGWLYGYGQTLRKGRDWRDRGNEAHCHRPDGVEQRHTPILSAEDYQRPVQARQKPKIRRVTQRPYQPTFYEGKAQYCVLLLQEALEAAKEAGAPYTVKRIEAALSSARGAVRNAGYRVTRAETEKRP